MRYCVDDKVLLINVIKLCVIPILQQCDDLVFSKIVSVIDTDNKETKIPLILEFESLFNKIIDTIDVTGNISLDTLNQIKIDYYKQLIKKKISLRGVLSGYTILLQELLNDNPEIRKKHFVFFCEFTHCNLNDKDKKFVQENENFSYDEVLERSNVLISESKFIEINKFIFNQQKGREHLVDCEGVVVVTTDGAVRSESKGNKKRKKGKA